MYLMVKALHLISVVAWFAGLFYIFRLFVYHVAHRNSSDCREMLSTMERKLLTMIMAPASALTFLCGGLLLWLNPALFFQGWIWAKLVLVLCLVGYHALSIYTFKCFSRGYWIFSEKQCRLINEVPTLVLVIVVFLAVTKPF